MTGDGYVTVVFIVTDVGISFSREHEKHVHVGCREKKMLLPLLYFYFVPDSSFHMYVTSLEFSKITWNKLSTRWCSLMCTAASEPQSPTEAFRWQEHLLRHALTQDQIR